MNFECKRCGQCCSNYLPLSEKEIRMMKKLAHKEHKRILLKEYYTICPFLNEKNLCDIYENRPMICREYNCDRFNNNEYSDEMIGSVKKENYRLVDIRKEIFNNEDRYVKKMEL